MTANRKSPESLSGKTPRDFGYAQVDQYVLAELESPSPSATSVEERLAQLERLVEAMTFRQRLLESFFTGLPQPTLQESRDRDDLGRRGHGNEKTYEPAERWKQRA